MKLIPLTGKYGAIIGNYAQVDDSDYEWLSQWRWSGHWSGKIVYAKRTKGIETILMHREILGLSNPKIQGDHKDHNGLNNQRNNIRIATCSQNNANSKKKGTGRYSDYKGVSYAIIKGVGYWTADCIKFNVSQSKVFKTEVEAALEYNKMAIELHGEFAYLNILTDEDSEMYKTMLEFNESLIGKSYCVECENWLPVENFYQYKKIAGDNKKTNGCHSYCKNCNNNRNKKYNQLKRDVQSRNKIEIERRGN